MRYTKLLTIVRYNMGLVNEVSSGKRITSINLKRSINSLCISKACTLKNISNVLRLREEDNLLERMLFQYLKSKGDGLNLSWRNEKLTQNFSITIPSISSLVIN